MTVLYAPSLSRKIRAQLAEYGVPVANADIPAFTAWVNASKAACGTAQFFVIRNPTASLTLDLRAAVANTPIRVWNGDGTTGAFSLATGADTNVGKVYGSSASRGIVVFGDFRQLRSDDAAGGGSDWFARANRLPASLTFLSVQGSNTLTGSVAGLTGLTLLSVYGSNTITGSVAGLTGLTLLSVWGNNTLTGSVAGLTGLTFLNVEGSNTLSYATTSGSTRANNARQLFVRPASAGVWTSAMTDALCIDLARDSTTWTNEKILDLRGNCGAATSASATARTTIAGRGVTVYVN